MQNGDEASGGIQNIEICQKSQNLCKLKNMQNKIINKYNILKTWLIRNFTQPAGMHYNHFVSPSVRPICISIRSTALIFNKLVTCY